MDMILMITEKVYKDLFVANLPKEVSEMFFNQASKIMEVTEKYCFSDIEKIENDFLDLLEEEIEDDIDDEEFDLTDIAETRFYYILRFCYIAKVVPTIETIVSLLHESEENLALSDFFFYDNTVDADIYANKIVNLALGLMNDVKEAMTIDLD